MTQRHSSFKLQKPRRQSLYRLGLSGIVLLVGICILGGSYRSMAARPSYGKASTVVEIDGIQYGVVEKVNGLQAASSTEPFIRVVLHRDFVTSPSLYHWARHDFPRRGDLIDIHLLVQGGHDEELASRYTLKNCKPLSWTVGAADLSVGGFHERIELAVQEVAVY